MAVQGVNQSHLTQPEPVNTLTSKAQPQANKSAAANTTAKLIRPDDAKKTTAADAAENHAGQEQGRHANGEEQETKGTLVSVFA
jgi:hypothetical protein